MRVLLVFDPRATWSWLQIPPESREEMESQVESVIMAQRWNETGISKRLARHDKMHSPNVCKKIMKATGGWHYLLDDLFDRCGNHDDPRPFAEEMQIELRDSNSRLAKDLVAAIGIHECELAQQMLDFLCKEGGKIEEELASHDLVYTVSDLSASDCERTFEYLEGISCIERRREIDMQAAKETWRNYIVVDSVLKSILSAHDE